MNILNKLTIKHLKQNKKRTVVTIIGIILSTALMVGIGLLFATVRDNAIKSIEKNNGSHHVLIKIPSDKLEIIKSNKTIKTYKYKSSLGYAKVDGIENDYKPYIEIFNASKNYLDNLELIEGRLPKNSNEIVISDSLLKNNSKIDLKIGDEINLSIGKRVDLDRNVLDNTSSYRLSYICKDNICDVMEEEINEKFIPDTNNKYIIVGICKRDILEPYTSPGYSAFTNSSDSNQLLIYITYNKVKDTYENTKKIVANLGLNLEKDVSYNTSLLAMYGVSEYNNLTDSLSKIICIILSLVSIGCIVVIYNSFAISVMERKKQFGLFSSIGTTKKQLKYTVFYEALIVGLIGIPLGILSAYLGIGIVLKIVNYLLPNVFEFPLSLVTYPIFLVIPVFFMIITIFVSAYIPAKRASKVSPIEAIRQNDDIKIKTKEVKTPKFIKKLFGIEGTIAYKNMKRNRKKYRITIVSLFVSIVLFISFSAFVNYGLESSIDYASMPEYDYIASINESYKYIDKINYISKQIIDTSNPKEYTVFSQLRFSVDDDNIKYRYSEDIKKTMFYDDTSMLNYVYVIGLDNDNYNDYIKKLGLKEKRPIVINKYSNIEYVNNTRKAINTKIFDYVDDFYVSYNKYDLEKEKKYTFNNVYLADDIPLGIDIDTINSLIVIIDMETFNKMYEDENNEQNYEMMVAMRDGNYKDANKIIEDNNKNFISCSGYDIKEELKLLSNMILVIKILLYGFVSLVTLIGITSVLNTINTSISLRRGEFAVLRSIGLTPKGFNKILLFESLFFGLKSLLYSIPVSIIIIILFHLSFNGIVEFSNLLIPWNSILVSVIGVFIIIAICMWYSSNRIKRENILEAIRNENI